MQRREINNILLLSLPAVWEPGVAENKYNADHAFNLGLAYLAGQLRHNGLNVRILDCLVEDPLNIRQAEPGWEEVGLSDEAIIAIIRDFGPDLIGVSIPFSCQHYLAHELVNKIREEFPEVLVVAGGNHVSAVPEKMDQDLFDYLIIGEGELAFQHLIDALNNGEAINWQQGVVTKTSLIHHHAPFIHDLNQLPFPAIDLLPVRKLWGNGRRWINMVATRGCVYDCNFCAIHTIMGYPIRRRSVENVIAEIEHWKKTFNIQEIYFEDDNLTTNRKWAKELFREIARHKFGLRLYARNGIRADSIDREMLTLMKAAGFHDFYIAPESGSQRTLDEYIGKKMKLEDVTNAVKLAGEVGIEAMAFFVLGFPEEDWNDLETTFKYAKYLKSLGCARFWVSVAAPYPGTRLHKQCLEQGLISEDIDYRRLRVAKSIIHNDNFTTGELEAYRNMVMDELNEPPLSIPAKIKKGGFLLVTDPNFLFVKLRYKLGAYL